MNDALSKLEKATEQLKNIDADTFAQNMFVGMANAQATEPLDEDVLTQD